MIRWIGAACIILGCGGWGYSAAHRLRMEERLLVQLLEKLQFMARELSCRCTPLPEMFTAAGIDDNDMIGQFFLDVADKLGRCSTSDASDCVHETLLSYSQFPTSIARLLAQFGRSLGRFDLVGQLEQLESVMNACKDTLERIALCRDTRIRSYRTYGLCAGLALAILLL